MLHLSTHLWFVKLYNNGMSLFGFKMLFPIEDWLLNVVETSFKIEKWKLHVVLFTLNLLAKNLFCKSFEFFGSSMINKIIFSRVKIDGGKYVRQEVTLKLEKQCCPELYWTADNKPYQLYLTPNLFGINLYLYKNW